VRESRSPVSPDVGASPLLWFAMVRSGHAPASPHGGASPFLWFAMVCAAHAPASPHGGASPFLWFAMVCATHAPASPHGGASLFLWFAMVCAAHAPASPHGGTPPLLWFAMVQDEHAPDSPHGRASPFLWFAMVGDIPRLAAPTTGGADATGGWRRRAAATRRVTMASRVGKSADIPRSRAIGAAPEGMVAAIVPRAGGHSYFRRYGRAIGGFDRWGIDISFAPTTGLRLWPVRLGLTFPRRGRAIAYGFWIAFGSRRSSGAHDASLERRGPNAMKRAARSGRATPVARLVDRSPRHWSGAPPAP
jgi:hypothetical protein